MAINTTAGLLDAIVLAVVGREETGTYGYRITQQLSQGLGVSESSLYPVLRRLQKDGCLTTYDVDRLRMIEPELPPEPEPSEDESLDDGQLTDASADAAQRAAAEGKASGKSDSTL